MLGGKLTVKAYDTAIAPTNACWSNLGDPVLSKPCVRWTYQRDDGTLNWGVKMRIKGSYAALATTSGNTEVILLRLSDGRATTFKTPAGAADSIFAFDVALNKTRAFSGGSGATGTFTTASFKFAVPTAADWFDNNLNGETRGLATVGETALYTCGRTFHSPAPNKVQLRSNQADTGALNWQVWGNTTKWGGLGDCLAVTGDTKHAFWAGNETKTVTAVGDYFFMASQNAATGADDWVHTGPQGYATEVAQEGDRIVAAGTDTSAGEPRCHMRVVEAVCATHGTEVACP
jgi:hypothetical protein